MLIFIIEFVGNIFIHGIYLMQIVLFFFITEWILYLYTPFYDIYTAGHSKICKSFSSTPLIVLVAGS